MAFGYRSRISQGGVNLNEEATYYLAKFSWKLHENEENWQLDPMHVLKCPNLDNCTFVRNDTDAYSYQMDDEKTPLRGGTSFQLYR